MKTLAFTAMGSRIFIAMDTGDDRLADEMKKSVQWFEEWEQALSRFRINSELSILNRRPGIFVDMSEPLYSVMEAAAKAEELSGGLVSPFLLEPLLAVGYAEDFEMLLSREQENRKPSILSQIEPDQVEFDRENRKICLPYGTQMDFGGIAKGWAAHQTMLRLNQYAPVLVDAGGDISISGKQCNGDGWVLGVANPFSPDENIALLTIDTGGVATSGKDYRHWTYGGHQQHHIIDPRTMMPADTNIISATVFTDNLMDAETVARTALILGSEEAVAWLEHLGQTGYLLVTEDGSVLRNQNLVEKQWKKQ